MSGNKIVSSIGDLIKSSPLAIALSQLTPLGAFISTYCVETYALDQSIALQEYLVFLEKEITRLKIQSLKFDDFKSKQGKRVLRKIINGVIKDNRDEKLYALAKATLGVIQNKALSFDEKEIYIDIINNINFLEINIVIEVVKIMRERNLPYHRGFGWEILSNKFKNYGISKALFLKSIRKLVSEGLLNENNATSVDEDKTHFITDFGEQFSDFISKN